MSFDTTNKDLITQRLDQRKHIPIRGNTTLDTLELQRQAYSTRKKIPTPNSYYSLPKLNGVGAKNLDIDLRKPVTGRCFDNPVFSGNTRLGRNSDLLNTRFSEFKPINTSDYAKYSESQGKFSHIPIDTRQQEYSKSSH